MQCYAFVCSVLEKSDPSLLKVGYYVPPSQRVLETNKASLSFEQDLLQCFTGEKNRNSEIIYALLVRAILG